MLAVRVIGDDRPYHSALIVVDGEAASACTTAHWMAVSLAALVVRTSTKLSGGKTQESCDTRRR